MELVQHCLYHDRLSGYKKEREFLLNVWLPNRNKSRNRSNTAQEEALTNTMVDAQFSAQMLKSMEQRLKENDKKLVSLQTLRTEVVGYLRERRLQEESDLTVIQKEEENMASLKKSLKEKIREQEILLQRIGSQYQKARQRKGSPLQPTERNSLCNDIKVSETIGSEILVMETKIDESFMKCERLRNKMVSEKWFVRKKGNELGRIDQDIQNAMKEILDIKREHKTLGLKQKINLTKIRRLKFQT